MTPTTYERVNLKLSASAAHCPWSRSIERVYLEESLVNAICANFVTLIEAVLWS